MRYRKLDANGDYTLGTGQDFLSDSPETVAQAIRTRLLLLRGECFIDTTDGTPWSASILGKYTASIRDSVIRERILGTQGVTQITNYLSSFDANSRKIYVQASVDTLYGPATISEVL